MTIAQTSGNNPRVHELDEAARVLAEKAMTMIRPPEIAIIITGNSMNTCYRSNILPEQLPDVLRQMASKLEAEIAASKARSGS